MGVKVCVGGMVGVQLGSAVGVRVLVGISVRVRVGAMVRVAVGVNEAAVVTVRVTVAVAVVVPVEVTVRVGEGVLLMVTSGVEVDVGLWTASVSMVSEGRGVGVNCTVLVNWRVDVAAALVRVLGGRDVGVGDDASATLILGLSVPATSVACSCTTRVDRAGSTGLNCAHTQGL